MKTAILMRHGEAGDAPSDHARPLTERGRQRCLQSADELIAAELKPERIVSSGAVRAQQTAELVAEALGFRAGVEVDASLYLAEPSHYLATLRATPPELSTVLLVAHNPGLSQLASHVRGRRVGLAPGDYALVRCEAASWRELG